MHPDRSRENSEPRRCPQARSRAPKRGVPHEARRWNAFLSECRGGDRARKACRGKGGRVGGACGQGIGGEGPATQASAPSPCACRALERQRAAVLICEGPASTMGRARVGLRGVRAPRRVGSQGACGRRGRPGHTGTEARRFFFCLRRALGRRLDLATGVARAFQACNVFHLVPFQA